MYIIRYNYLISHDNRQLGKNDRVQACCFTVSPRVALNASELQVGLTSILRTRHAQDFLGPISAIAAHNHSHLQQQKI
jgi:hypothetical protein